VAGDILYGHVRCQLVHQGEIAADHRALRAGRSRWSGLQRALAHESAGIPGTLVLNRARGVIEASENKEPFSGSTVAPSAARTSDVQERDS
jgi:hypothetical protein